MLCACRKLKLIDWSRQGSRIVYNGPEKYCYSVEKSKTSSKRYTSIIVNSAQSIVSSDIFDWIVTGVILLQALVLAIEATPALLTVHRDDELLEAETFSLIQSLVVTVLWSKSL